MSSWVRRGPGYRMRSKGVRRSFLNAGNGEYQRTTVT